MSDTDAKVAKRREEAKKAKARNQRRANSSISVKARKTIIKVAAIALACILALIIILPNIGATKRAVTAMKVGENEISSAEFSYYYTEQLNNLYYTYYYYGLTDYFPIDTTTSLKKQIYSGEMTYADYFEQQAIASIREAYVLYSEALADGYELTEADQKNIDTQLETIDTTAKSYGYSTNRYLRRNYGPGVNRKLFEKILTVQTIASSYAAQKGESFTYTLEQLASYYNTHKEDLDKIDIRYYKVAVTNKADATDEEKAEALEAARLQAETLVNGITTEEEYSANILNYLKSLSADPESVTTETSLHSAVTYTSLKGNSKNLADWATKAGRTAGDMGVVDAGDETGYYAVYMVTPSYRDNYETVDVRHILVSLGSYDKNDTEAAEAAKKVAHAEAEKLLEEWKNNPTEENFAAMADKNSADSPEGGLYTKVYKNQMVSPFNDWIFDAERKPGDTGIVDTEYGSHVMYFVGTNVPYWQVSAESSLRSEDYAAYYEEAAKKYEVTTNAFGLWYRTEPLK